MDAKHYGLLYLFINLILYIMNKHLKYFITGCIYMTCLLLFVGFIFLLVRYYPSASAIGSGIFALLAGSYILGRVFSRD